MSTNIYPPAGAIKTVPNIKVKYDKHNSSILPGSPVYIIEKDNENIAANASPKNTFLKELDPKTNYLNKNYIKENKELIELIDSDSIIMGFTHYSTNKIAFIERTHVNFYYLLLMGIEDGGYRLKDRVRIATSTQGKTHAALDIKKYEEEYVGVAGVGNSSIGESIFFHFKIEDDKIVNTATTKASQTSIGGSAFTTILNLYITKYTNGKKKVASTIINENQTGKVLFLKFLEDGSMTTQGLQSINIHYDTFREKTRLDLHVLDENTVKCIYSGNSVMVAATIKNKVNRNYVSLIANNIYGVSNTFKACNVALFDRNFMFLCNDHNTNDYTMGVIKDDCMSPFNIASLKNDDYYNKYSNLNDTAFFRHSFDKDEPILLFDNTIRKIDALENEEYFYSPFYTDKKNTPQIDETIWKNIIGFDEYNGETVAFYREGDFLKKIKIIPSKSGQASFIERDKNYIDIPKGRISHATIPYSIDTNTKHEFLAVTQLTDNRYLYMSRYSNSNKKNYIIYREYNSNNIEIEKIKVLKNSSYMNGGATTIEAVNQNSAICASVDHSEGKLYAFYIEIDEENEINITESEIGEAFKSSSNAPSYPAITQKVKDDGDTLYLACQYLKDASYIGLLPFSFNKTSKTFQSYTAVELSSAVNYSQLKNGWEFVKLNEEQILWSALNYCIILNINNGIITLDKKIAFPAHEMFYRKNSNTKHAVPIMMEENLGVLVNKFGDRLVFEYKNGNIEYIEYIENPISGRMTCALYNYNWTPYAIVEEDTYTIPDTSIEAVKKKVVYTCLSNGNSIHSSSSFTIYGRGEGASAPYDKIRFSDFNYKVYLGARHCMLRTFSMNWNNTKYTYKYPIDSYTNMYSVSLNEYNSIDDIFNILPNASTVSVEGHMSQAEWSLTHSMSKQCGNVSAAIYKDRILFAIKGEDGKISLRDFDHLKIHYYHINHTMEFIDEKTFFYHAYTATALKAYFAIVKFNENYKDYTILAEKTNTDYSGYFIPPTVKHSYNRMDMGIFWNKRDNIAYLTAGHQTDHNQVIKFPVTLNISNEEIVSASFGSVSYNNVTYPSPSLYSFGQQHRSNTLLTDRILLHVNYSNSYNDKEWGVTANWANSNGDFGYTSRYKKLQITAHNGTSESDMPQFSSLRKIDDHHVILTCFHNNGEPIVRVIYIDHNYDTVSDMRIVAASKEDVSQYIDHGYPPYMSDVFEKNSKFYIYISMENFSGPPFLRLYEININSDSSTCSINLVSETILSDALSVTHTTTAPFMPIRTGDGEALVFKQYSPYGVSIRRYKEGKGGSFMEMKAEKAPPEPNVSSYHLDAIKACKASSYDPVTDRYIWVHGDSNILSIAIKENNAIKYWGSIDTNFDTTLGSIDSSHPIIFLENIPSIDSDTSLFLMGAYFTDGFMNVLLLKYEKISKTVTPSLIIRSRATHLDSRAVLMDKRYIFIEQGIESKSFMRLYELNTDVSTTEAILRYENFTKKISIPPNSLSYKISDDTIYVYSRHNSTIRCYSFENFEFEYHGSFDVALDRNVFGVHNENWGYNETVLTIHKHSEINYHTVVSGEYPYAPIAVFKNDGQYFTIHHENQKTYLNAIKIDADTNAINIINKIKISDSAIPYDEININDKSMLISRYIAAFNTIAILNIEVNNMDKMYGIAQKIDKNSSLVEVAPLRGVSTVHKNLLPYSKTYYNVFDNTFTTKETEFYIGTSIDDKSIMIKSTLLP